MNNILIKNKYVLLVIKTFIIYACKVHENQDRMHKKNLISIEKLYTYILKIIILICEQIEVLLCEISSFTEIYIIYIY